MLKREQKSKIMTEKEKEHISDATEYGYYSDCCGAEVVMGDICLQCKEHCECVEEEES